MDKLSCRKATFLSVKKSEEGLSLSENIMLSYHNKLCKVCKFWDEQSRLIDYFLKNNIEDRSSRSLTPDEKEHIKSKVMKSP
nr:hypothetical protein [Saprospiraceae bacterium]